MIDLGDGENLVSEQLNELSDGQEINIDELRENIQERINSQADNECIYVSDCLTLISDLDIQFTSAIEDEGPLYTAEKWGEAARSYAIALVTVALEHYVNEAINTLQEQIELWTTEVDRLNGNSAKYSLGSCIYGWEAHNYETCEGVMVWSDERNHPNGCFNPSLLENSVIAVSFQIIGGTYINACWTPEVETEDG